MKSLAIAFSCVAYLFFFQIYPNHTNTNELTRLLLTSALVEDHSFQIDNAIKRYGDTEDKSFFRGHFYSAKSIGYSVLAVPFYFLLQVTGRDVDGDVLIYFLRLFINMIPLLFFTLFFFRYLRDSIKIGDKSYLFIAAFIFGTLVYTYAQLFMSHLLTGLLWFSAFNFVCERPTRKFAFVAGAILGISFLLEFPSVLVMMACGIWLLLFQRSLVPSFLIGASLSSAPAFLYNWCVFEGLLEWPYKYTYFPHLQAGHAGGYVGLHLPSLRVLWELTFGTSRGFFFFMPHLFFGLIGLVLEKMRRKESSLALAIILVNFIFYSGYYSWDGGQAFGPRFLVPLIPFLVYGCALGYQQLKEFGEGKTIPQIISYAYLLSLAFSVGLMLFGTVTFPFSPRFLPNPALWENITFFWRGFFGMNLGDFLGMMDGSIQFIAILIVVVPVMYFIFRAKIRPLQWITFFIVLVLQFPVSYWLQRSVIEPRTDARHCFVIGRVGYIQANYSKGLEFLNMALTRNPYPELREETNKWIIMVNSKIIKQKKTSSTTSR